MDWSGCMALNYDPGCSFLFSFDFWPFLQSSVLAASNLLSYSQKSRCKRVGNQVFFWVAKQCQYYCSVLPDVNALCFQLASMKEDFKRGSVSCGEVQSQRCLCSKCTDMCEGERNHEIKKKKRESHSHPETTYTTVLKWDFFFFLKNIKLTKSDKEDCCFPTKTFCFK